MISWVSSVLFFEIFRMPPSRIPLRMFLEFSQISYYYKSYRCFFFGIPNGIVSEFPAVVFLQESHRKIRYEFLMRFCKISVSVSTKIPLGSLTESFYVISNNSFRNSFGISLGLLSQIRSKIPPKTCS